MTTSSDRSRSSFCVTIDRARQGDLFTGEFNEKPPKRGNGHHIKLAVEVGEPAKAPGMAHFPATGPKRTYCHQCTYCQDIDVYRGGRYRAPPDLSGKGNPLPIGTKRDACLKAAKLSDGIVQRGGIGGNPSCKYFEKRSFLEPQKAMAEPKSMDAAFAGTNLMTLPRSD